MSSDRNFLITWRTTSTCNSHNITKWTFKPVCPTAAELNPPSSNSSSNDEGVDEVVEVVVHSPSPSHKQLTLTQLLQEKKDKDAAENKGDSAARHSATRRGQREKWCASWKTPATFTCAIKDYDSRLDLIGLRADVPKSTLSVLYLSYKFPST